MQFLADECLPNKTISFLKNAGFDVVTVEELDLCGTNDDDIINKSISQKLILITVDKDFGNILLYPPKTHFGIIVLKLLNKYESQIHSLLVRFLRRANFADIKGNLVIIDKNKVRIRRAPEE